MWIVYFLMGLGLGYVGMKTWINLRNRVLRTYRLRKHRCPYCADVFQTARIIGPERSIDAILCPEYHYGFLYPDGPEGRYVQVDNDGLHLGIPENAVVWGNTIPTIERP
jgi:hypothetical protein